MHSFPYFSRASGALGRRRSSQGFTLLEMLVVMVLLSIIMLAMVSGMRSAGQSSDRVDAGLERQDEVRVAERFVRGTLGRMSQRPLAGASLQSTPMGSNMQSNGNPPILFEGAPNQVSWVGVMPARYGAGGRNFFRLSVEPVGQGAGLVMRYVPWSDQTTFPDWGSAASQVLLTEVTGLALQYENDRPENMDAATEWVSPWNHQDYAPAHIAISIERGSRSPIEWVVPIWGLLAGKPGALGGDEDVIGGTVE